MTIAWLEHLQGRRVSTIETLTQVLVLDPDYAFRPELYSEDFLPLFYQARERAIQTREAEASKLVREGSALLRERRLAEARGRFERALEVWPDQIRALYNLALVDYHAGELEAALDGFQKLLSLDTARPGLVDAEVRGLSLTNLGLVYLDQDLPAEAVGVLEQAVVSTPESGAAWSNLGVAKRREGDRQGAIAAFRRASDLDPEDLAASRNLALAYLDAGDPAAAEGFLRRATTRFADDPGLWLYLGLALDRQGRRATAQEAFETSLARDPDNRQGWAISAALQLASVAFARGDAATAAGAAERAVGWDPEQVNGWVYRGLALQATGELQSAVDALEEARRREPRRADIHNSLGSVLFELGLYDEAEAAFRRALELDPGLSSARQNLEATSAVRRGDAVAGRGSASAGRSRPATSAGSRPRPAPPVRQRADIGVRFADIDYGSLGLRGAMVETVFRDSAAGRAGLQADDLLLEMNGRPVTDGPTFRDYIFSLEPGTEVTLRLLRANRPLTLLLTAP
ncbi:MAG: tetratricopeptide repeat protein, partial [Holophagales bacterium]|nr:tetratricopeptide repeat protein [Holophagales bacterium]